MKTPLRLLIVEDSPLDAQILVHRLESFGYAPAWERVDDQTGLREALDRQSWDIVLCDYAMPRYNGLDALQTIRTVSPDLPVILVSGTIGEDGAVEAMRAGAYDYLLKDRLARLGAAVQRSLEEAKHRRERRRSEERLRLLFHAIEHSPASIVITDPSGRIEYANPRFTQDSGWSLEEVRGQNPRLLKSGAMSPAEYTRLWKTILAGGEWRGEFCNRKKTGELIWESAAVSPVRDSRGQITHFVKVAEDITHRKQTDEAFRRLDAQLRRAQKMEALGEMAGGIAHDFNSYLGAIVTTLQLARTGLDPNSQTGEYLDRAASASRQAAGLARQMLSFSRRDESQRRLVPLGSVVLETLRLLEASLPPGVDCAIDIPTAGRAVLADASQVQQAVVNLWTNACHSFQGRKGRITVSLADVDLDASEIAQYPGLSAGPYVRLTVRDDGCGMDPEVREQIFEPFFTTKPEGQGTGLGLSVVQTIVTSHHGAAMVESWPGQGTAMHLLFPAESVGSATMSAAMPRPDGPLPLGSGELIMLVDDHALIQDAMRTLLEQLGYRVRVFGNPLQALDSFRMETDDYDLVLTDLSMREMNGAELAREVLSIRPTVPVVVSSGYDLPGLYQCIRELGIREVLAKPVERDRLAVALARALGRTYRNDEQAQGI